MRRFRADPVSEATLDALFRLADLLALGRQLPADPLRAGRRRRRGARAIAANFEAANREALGAYRGRAGAALRQAQACGPEEAPVHLAVFCDEATELGHGLGARTMPETRRYSAVCALYTFWLAARAHGLGVGWVSILDPRAIAEIARRAAGAGRFIGYLCVGWPEEENLTPELERAGWQAPRRADADRPLRSGATPRRGVVSQAP